MNKEICNFGADVDKILHLMIHSLYTNKDIFLRELVSNASDACDKLRYEAIKCPELINNNPLKIIISVDKQKNLLTIKDNGIGMSKEELIQNLGTIASSGTKKFLENLSGNHNKDLQLIGQFGVGFYSVFMVAEEVWVKTLKAGQNKSWVWHSAGDNKFTIERNYDKAEKGTEIIVKIKEGEEQYLDRFRINHIINTYSDHISIPIEFYSEEIDKAKILNSSSALWTRPKKDISLYQYKEFYRKVAQAGDEPWMIIHNVNEGKVNFTNLLFIPSSPTFDMYHPDRIRRIKLYINKVFINDEGIDLIPHYLRFLRGVIDSTDLPLNISRENLQHNNTLITIKETITKRVINDLATQLQKSKEKYIDFWENFGSVIKEGLCESINVPEKLIEICLFKHLNSTDYISLNEYIQAMPTNQKEIYYASGEDVAQLKQHPQLQGFIEKNYNVLFFIDTVDDFWVNVISQYKDIPIKSITRADIDLEETKSNINDNENQQLVNFTKETLGNIIAEVKISKKLSSAPACLSVKEGAIDIRMERYLIEQKQLKSPAAKIFEINIHHPIIKKISCTLNVNSKKDLNQEIIKSLYDQACIIEGQPVSNPQDFSRRFNNLLLSSLDL